VDLVEAVDGLPVQGDDVREARPGGLTDCCCVGFGFVAGALGVGTGAADQRVGLLGGAGVAVGRLAAGVFENLRGLVLRSGDHLGNLLLGGLLLSGGFVGGDLEQFTDQLLAFRAFRLAADEGFELPSQVLDFSRLLVQPVLDLPLVVAACHHGELGQVPGRSCYRLSGKPGTG
jgi:hypothetical protein